MDKIKGAGVSAKSNDKIEYLRKVFAHTQGKTFENYVITQIWAGVKRLGLRPVAQQYVKRPGGKYALLDLYFPQLRFPIEVDEPHHDHNMKADEIRQDDIFSAIENATIMHVKYSDNYEDIDDNYEDIEKQIKDIIDKISERVKSDSKKGFKFKWNADWREDEYKVDLREVKAQRKLSVNNNIAFTKKQVYNDIFGITRYSPMRGGMFIPNTGELKHIWFPKLKLDGAKQSPTKSWENTMNADWTQIAERPLKDKPVNEKYYNPKTIRYTFAKYKNRLGESAYRFIGAFQFDRVEKGVRYFKRVADYMEL